MLGRSTARRIDSSSSSSFLACFFLMKGPFLRPAPVPIYPLPSLLGWSADDFRRSIRSGNSASRGASSSLRVTSSIWVSIDLISEYVTFWPVSFPYRPAIHPYRSPSISRPSTPLALPYSRLRTSTMLIGSSVLMAPVADDLNLKVVLIFLPTPACAFGFSLATSSAAPGSVRSVIVFDKYSRRSMLCAGLSEAAALDAENPSRIRRDLSGANT